MPNKLFLKPAIGLAVWLPARQRDVLAEGENIEVDAYIARRIADGDLVEVKGEKKNKQTVEVADVHPVLADSRK